jgi:hypothetical protein
MRYKFTAILLYLAIMLFSACQSGQDNARSTQILGEDLLKNSARSSGLSFKTIPTIKLFDASSIDIKANQLEEITFETLAQGTTNSQENALILKELIQDKSFTPLKLELMLSDEPLKRSIVLLSIESPNNQSCSLELWDEKGQLISANRELILKEGTNYKLINLEEFDQQQYLLLLKDENGSILMRKISPEQLF